jgi:hypothetical protein
MTEDVLAVRDFSDIPGPRLRAQGDHSGQEFYEDYLLPAFEAARNTGFPIVVDLDGVEGYATVFLDETFGKLARQFGSMLVKQYLILRSTDDETIISDIEDYYKDADEIRSGKK